MAFWSEKTTEPNRQFRWYINFGGEVLNNQGQTLDAIRYALKKCTKPSFKLEVKEHWYLNHKFNYPGRVVWEPIDITFASVTGNGTTDANSAGLLYELFISAGYVLPTAAQDPSNRDSVRSISKAAAVAALGALSLIQIDANGQPVETWKLENPFFTDVKFGDLDYANEEIVDITCKIVYDSANLVTTPATEASVSS